MIKVMLDNINLVGYTSRMDGEEILAIAIKAKEQVDGVILNG